MATSEQAAALEAGLEALAAGRWDDAAATLGAMVVGTPPATEVAARERRCAALEGLSEALWWTGRVDEALATRAQAYEAWRGLEHDLGAARAATWLAREHAALGNEVVGRGWLARAETLAATGGQAAAGAPSVEVAGWVALTRAVLAPDPPAQASAARAALEHARAARSGDLEVLALGRLGLATVAAGRLDDGLRCFDEAMAAATGGEASLSTLASLCCDLVFAGELSGELDRFAQWNAVVESLAARHGHPSLVAFCSTCCAEAFAAAGDWERAEHELRTALSHLRQSGHRARCAAPAAKLADVLLAQGRVEEAEAVLRDEQDDALLARARLALARDDPATAVTLATRQCRRLGGPSLLTAPALALLAEAQVAAGELGPARAAASALQAVGEGNGHRRTLGRGLLALAQVDAAEGDDATARARLEDALDHLSAVAPGDVETARARLELARLCARDAPQLALAEAKAALAGFDAAGAAHRADEAAALLRRLGDRSRTGAKQPGGLTRREQEVLRLVAEGLTNAEIAERLYIAPKTASNHVSHILEKLGLRSRVEAARYATRDGVP